MTRKQLAMFVTALVATASIQGVGGHAAGAKCAKESATQLGAGAIQEENGLATAEIESVPATGSWVLEKCYKGYMIDKLTLQRQSGPCHVLSPAEAALE